MSCHSEVGDSPETDRLLRKISELTEILEARETKMVELSRSNLELQEQNMDLQRFVGVVIKDQCDQIGRFLNDLGDEFCHKSSPNYGDFWLIYSITF